MDGHQHRNATAWQVELGGRTSAWDLLVVQWQLNATCGRKLSRGTRPDSWLASTERGTRVARDCWAWGERLPIRGILALNRQGMAQCNVTLGVVRTDSRHCVAAVPRPNMCMEWGAKGGVGTAKVQQVCGSVTCG